MEPGLRLFRGLFGPPVPVPISFDAAGHGCDGIDVVEQKWNYGVE
jgi:hypothetical protein